MLDFILKLSKKAGKIHLKYYGKKTFSKKSSRELITVADIESEKFLIKSLRKKFPRDSILSEETMSRKKVNAARLWIIDPLDGTNNFVRKIPFFCVSIALEVDGKVVLGVIHNPLLDETFYTEGRGASYFNGKRIRVSGQSKLEESFLVTGFPYNRRRNSRNNLNYFNQFTMKCLGIRRLGSAALDLCYVSKGIFDAYWELNMHAWDIAAGGLILKNAGGTITNLVSKKWNIYEKDVLGTNGLLHQKMQRVIRKIDETRLYI